VDIHSGAIVLMRMFLNANVLFTAAHIPKGKVAYCNGGELGAT
jgi:hypothetical protein